MGRPKVGSLFAGVEGFGQGLEEAGFEVAWQVEIDKDAVSVLERHYPTTHRVRDVREAGAHNLTPVDVLTFGSPCQGFSVAGRGEGLEDARSGLFGEAVRIIRELRPAVAVWENVPGAFSANDGRDFGAVLAALAESGAVDIAWRVLDAQWFGVPQRRRRIFLVADFRAERAGQVLFEPDRSAWDLAASGEAWQGASGDAEDGARVASTLRVGSDSLTGTHSDDVAVCPWIAGTQGTGDPRTLQDAAAGLFIPVASADSASYGNGSPRGDGCDNLIADTVRSHLRPGSNSVGLLAPTLNASGAGKARPGGQGAEAGFYVTAVAQNQRGELREMPIHPSLTVGGGKPGEGYPAVLHGIDWQKDGCTVEDGTPTLTTSRTPAVSGRPGMAVRRLTPRECERLMGWPDDWTRYRADGSEIPDGPRYRMIGNGVVRPVAAWIGRRLLRALEDR